MEMLVELEAYKMCFAPGQVMNLMLRDNLDLDEALMTLVNRMLNEFDHAFFQLLDCCATEQQQAELEEHLMPLNLQMIAEALSVNYTDYSWIVVNDFPGEVSQHAVIITGARMVATF